MIDTTGDPTTVVVNDVKSHENLMARLRLAEHTESLRRNLKGDYMTYIIPSTMNIISSPITTLLTQSLEFCVDLT